jgi:hypothetical protein
MLIIHCVFVSPSLFISVSMFAHLKNQLQRIQLPNYRLWVEVYKRNTAFDLPYSTTSRQVLEIMLRSPYYSVAQPFDRSQPLDLQAALTLQSEERKCQLFLRKLFVGQSAQRSYSFSGDVKSFEKKRFQMQIAMLTTSSGGNSSKKRKLAPPASSDDHPQAQESSSSSPKRVKVKEKSFEEILDNISPQPKPQQPLHQPPLQQQQQQQQPESPLPSTQPGTPQYTEDIEDEWLFSS